MPPPERVDGCGRRVTVPAHPRRVLSLCPSLTETLVALGVTPLARTRYCVHPGPQIDALPVVGGTKNPDLDAIRALRPDLVIAEKEENRAEDVAALAAEMPVFVQDIRSFAGALAAIGELGALLGRPAAADRLVGDIETAWSGVPRAAGDRVLYLIWRKPWMAAGADTYIDSVLSRLGCENVAAGLSGRYPELDPDTMRALQPQRVLLSSEPFPFAEKHIEELRRILPDAAFELVDGEAYSWYGARMVAAAEYFCAG